MGNDDIYKHDLSIPIFSNIGNYLSPLEKYMMHSFTNINEIDPSYVIYAKIIIKKFNL